MRIIKVAIVVGVLAALAACTDGHGKKQFGQSLTMASAAPAVSLTMVDQAAGVHKSRA